MKTKKSFNVIFELTFTNSQTIQLIRTEEMYEESFTTFLGKVDAYKKVKEHVQSILNEKVQFYEINQLVEAPIIAWTQEAKILDDVHLYVKGCQEFCEYIESRGGIMGNAILDITSMKVVENILTITSKYVEI